MIAAILCAALFACSAAAGARAARYWGGQQANLLRLFFATVLLGATSLVLFPGSFRLDTFAWLFFSGIIGFGLGDLGLFLAYVRIGARLTILLNLCTAPLWSILAEWIWLGTVLNRAQFSAIAVVLAGVALALWPGKSGLESREAKAKITGILLALVAGCGQGLGAVISRKAFEIAGATGLDINGISAAAQRVGGGFCFALVVWLVLVAFSRIRFRLPAGEVRKPAVAWLLATALLGPVLGVSAFQWALWQLPSGIVTTITATSPILIIPLAMVIEKERPHLVSIFGAVLAVGGVILLLAAG